MGKRGPKPGMGGRPKSPIVEKIANGNPGKRPLTVLDFKNSASDLEGKPMPKPSEYLSAEQKNGTQFFAVEIYEATWNWLKDCGCESLVNPHVLEEYAMCKARWIQCENLNSEFGFLAKHTPKTKTSKRDIPLSSFLYDVLWNEKKRTGSKFIISRKEDFVSPRTYEYRFHRLLEDCCISPVNYHVLRHTFATRCVTIQTKLQQIKTHIG